MRLAVQSIQGPCRAASTIAFYAQCIPQALLVFFYLKVYDRKAEERRNVLPPDLFCAKEARLIISCRQCALWRCPLLSFLRALLPSSRLSSRAVRRQVPPRPLPCAAPGTSFHPGCACSRTWLYRARRQGYVRARGPSR